MVIIYISGKCVEVLEALSYKGIPVHIQEPSIHNYGTFYKVVNHIHFR